MTALARRTIVTSIAGLPLAAILADPRLAAMAADTLETVGVTTPGGRKVSAALAVPAKTPAPIKEKLHQEIAKALQSPAVAEKLKNLGADPLPLSSAQFDALVRKEIETNSRIANAANIRVE